MELFLTLPDSPAQYFEFQVSPVGQRFNLGIISPREVTFSPLDINWKCRIECQKELWESWLIFPFTSGPGELVGNAHACLGTGERDYFSLYGADQNPPDFHRPEIFDIL